MSVCQTSVRVPDPIDRRSYRFVACGRPTTQRVTVGYQKRWYCDEHAAAARRLIESQGQAAIVDIQCRVR
jgi:hypothetical protein